MPVAFPTRLSRVPCAQTRCAPAFPRVSAISSRFAPTHRCGAAGADEAPTLAEEAAAPGQRRPDPGDNVLYVTRLPKETDNAALAQLADGQPGLQQAFVYTKPERNVSLVFLVFDSAESAASARQALHKTQFGGKTIQVRLHRTNEESKSRSRRNNNPAQQQQDGSSTAPETQQQRKRKQRPQSTAVYVGNLAWATLGEDLKEHFSSSCDGVADAFLLLQKDGKPSGSGFVLFDSPDAAAAAVQKMEGTQLDGRTLVVKPANERQPAAAPAAAAPAAPAAAGEAPEPGSALHHALAGAAGNERRVVVRNGPAGFGWREYVGMCSVFGLVRRVAVYDPHSPGSADSAMVEGGSAGEGGEDAAIGSSGSAAAGGSGGGRQSKAFAVVWMADRAAAEAVVQGLFGRQVQGSKLTVMLYKQPKRVARQQQQQKQAAPAAGEGSGSGGGGSEEVVVA